MIVQKKNDFESDLLKRMNIIRYFVILIFILLFIEVCWYYLL